MAAKKVTKGTLKSASGRGDTKDVKFDRTKVSGKTESINLGKINAATGNTASRDTTKSKNEISKDEFKKISGAGPARNKVTYSGANTVETNKFRDTTEA
ncbi:MAG: hypothetical protein KF699_05490 [Phycisphaeraceae bacterium]|nr:hypothetical protein [Phycisphaeraceae bacterium]MBX3408049.1 hypothetical protein [Phycisphaeraceae bacterium]